MRILQVNFASWEPPHGRFFFRYPWNLYQKVGSMTRHYAYCVDALDELLKSEIQVLVENSDIIPLHFRRLINFLSSNHG